MSPNVIVVLVHLKLQLTVLLGTAKVQSIVIHLKVDMREEGLVGEKFRFLEILDR